MRRCRIKHQFSEAGDGNAEKPSLSRGLMRVTREGAVGPYSQDLPLVPHGTVLDFVRILLATARRV